MENIPLKESVCSAKMKLCGSRRSGSLSKMLYFAEKEKENCDHPKLMSVVLVHCFEA